MFHLTRKLRQATDGEALTRRDRRPRLRDVAVSPAGAQTAPKPLTIVFVVDGLRPSPLTVEPSRSAWTAPVSHDVVTVAFKQHVSARDALRTGTYTKTLTFTLSTTTP